MVMLARAQVRRLEEIAPESSGGGTLILATITPGAVMTEQVCTLVRLRRLVEPAAQSAQTIYSPSRSFRTWPHPT